MLDTLKPKHRKLVEDELIPDEQVLAVVHLRENQALALTGRRVIVVNGSLLFRGANAMQLADIATVSSGAMAIALGLRNGNEWEFRFWPSGGNRAAAQSFVRRLREAQMPASTTPSGPAASVAANSSSSGSYATRACSPSRSSPPRKRPSCADNASRRAWARCPAP